VHLLVSVFGSRVRERGRERVRERGREREFCPRWNGSDDDDGGAEMARVLILGLLFCEEFFFPWLCEVSSFPGFQVG
jgi:hypothetical protein